MEENLVLMVIIIELIIRYDKLKRLVSRLDVNAKNILILIDGLSL